ncbi:MAG: hypothetical protein M1577_05020 [Chloroflexi bacterium]|nr:hypothetical protein [Chloroflexota bacterium]
MTLELREISRCSGFAPRATTSVPPCLGFGGVGVGVATTTLVGVGGTGVGDGAGAQLARSESRVSAPTAPAPSLRSVRRSIFFFDNLSMLPDIC